MSKKSNVWVFMLIAYGFSWMFWVPDALIAQNIWQAPEGVKTFLETFTFGAWGPFVAAIVMTFIYQRGAGVKALLKRGFMVRLGKWWWPALFIFPVLIGGSLFLSVAVFGNPMPASPALDQPFTLPIAFVFIFFLGGPLQEEFGWRGYVFENLRHKYSALTATVVAGLMWGLWHLPLFFVPREDYYYNRPMWGLILTTMLVGIIIAWIYVNTDGSVFAAMLAHTMFNWSNYVFPTLDDDTAALILFGFYGIVVAYILWKYSIKTFTRKQIE